MRHTFLGVLRTVVSGGGNDPKRCAQARRRTWADAATRAKRCAPCAAPFYQRPLPSGLPRTPRGHCSDLHIGATTMTDRRWVHGSPSPLGPQGSAAPGHAHGRHRRQAQAEGTYGERPPPFSLDRVGRWVPQPRKYAHADGGALMEGTDVRYRWNAQPTSHVSRHYLSSNWRARAAALATAPRKPLHR